MRTIPEPTVKPGRLHAGSRVALVAPAGPIDEVRLDRALAMCRGMDLEPVVGKAALSRTGYLAGPDEARAADLQSAISDPWIDAIWALRGGYGTARLFGRIDFSTLRERPKAYVGFSDNTSVLLALARLGIIGFHGPHAGGDLPEFAEQCFRRMLFDGTPFTLETPADAPLDSWVSGTAEGRLIGGNLAVIAAAEGTPYAIPADGAIIFFEDISEAPYRIDRLLTQLFLSGAFERVAGVIVGQFSDCDAPSGSASEVLQRELLRFGVPIVANAPIGHVADNWTLPVGARVRLDSNAGHSCISLLEAVTTQ